MRHLVYCIMSVVCTSGPGSSVGITTDYGMRFSAPVQTGPGAHPASCTMGTGFFPGVKRPGRGFEHPTLLAPRLRMSIPIPLLPL
jgi:hypothetical protein